MSGAVVGLVFAHYHRHRQSTSHICVLAALAECGNDMGGSIYPSRATIAQRTGMSARWVKQIVRDLEADGVLVATSNKRGGPKGATVNYRIDLDRLRTPPNRPIGAKKRAGRPKKTARVVTVPVESGETSRSVG